MAHWWTKGLLGAAVLPMLMWAGQAGSPVWAAEPPPVKAAALSVDELRTQARAGQVAAQVEWASRLRAGQGVAKDEGEALHWFTEAAMKGHVEAQFALAQMFAELGQDPQSPLLARLALSASQSQRDAAGWFRRAAEQGHVQAQYERGRMLAEGRGVVRNQREAVEWYTQAAEQGLADAQQALGFMLVNGGIGVTRDVPEGLRWLYAAAQQGQPLAISWYRQGAESGYPPAQYTLGLLHAKGQGVAKDDQAALSWYRKAAEQGWPDAQYALGRRLEVGEGVPKDEQAAAALYFNAARQDHVQAQS